MCKQIDLDVSELVPPEPMEEILDVLQDLQQDEFIKVKHCREPYPLYGLINEMGFNYSVEYIDLGELFIYIYFKNNKKLTKKFNF